MFLKSCLLSIFFWNIQLYVKYNIFKASKLSFPEFCTRISCKALGPDSIVLLKHEEALGGVDWLEIRAIDCISSDGQMSLVFCLVIEFSFILFYSDEES